MDKTIKILVIVVVILIGILGIVGGVLLQSNFTNKSNSSVVNQSNIINPNSSSKTGKTPVVNVSTTNQSIQQSSNDNFISPDQAIKIAKKYVDPSAQGLSFKVTYIINGQKPYYQVDIISTNMGDAKAYIDAKTGKMIGGYN
jgi:hypothetical protein